MLQQPKKPDEEIELFYESINSLLASIKSRGVTVILGDFNAKIGKGKCDKYVGEYGLGIRNEKGDFLPDDYIPGYPHKTTKRERLEIK